MTLLQVTCAVLLRNAAWWKVALAAYTIGGTLSQNLFTAQHELSHFLAFRTPVYNRILSLISNCPLVVPMAAEFRKYHQEHHSHLVIPCSDVLARAWLATGTTGCCLPACLPAYVTILPHAGKPSMPVCDSQRLVQGVDGWDVDLPTYLEANYICTTVTKTLWVLVYIAVYGLRPVIIRPKRAGEAASSMKPRTLPILPLNLVS